MGLLLGLGLIALATAGGWLVRGSLRTGLSTGGYFVDSSREGNPFLFWFDTVIMLLASVMTALVGMVAVARSF